MLENIIAFYCGPALAGIKPANIASCRKSAIADIHKEIELLNFQLNKKDIYVDIICECEARALVMVYRKNVLEKHLNNPEHRNFLDKYGYSDASSLEDYINILKSRLSMDDFPHEIGVFLGYPLHDIFGFINHRNEGCLMVGEWKVYKHPEEAKKLFKRYEDCRKAIVRRLERGNSLAQIFCAA